MADVPGHAPVGWLGRVEAVVKIATGLSLIIGIVVTVWGPGGLMQASKKTRLDSLATIKELVVADYDAKRQMVELDWKSIEERICSDLAAGRAGHSIYFSGEPLKSLANIGEHYERIGAMVALDYLPFDLIFEVISFPDDFWHRVAPARSVLAQHWRSDLFQRRSLPDLWGNFYYLCERFKHSRMKGGSPSVSCRPNVGEISSAAPCLKKFDSAQLPDSPSRWRTILW